MMTRSLISAGALVLLLGGVAYAAPHMTDLASVLGRPAVTQTSEAATGTLANQPVAEDTAMSATPTPTPLLASKRAKKAVAANSLAAATPSANLGAQKGKVQPPYRGDVLPGEPGPRVWLEGQVTQVDGNQLTVHVRRGTFPNQTITVVVDPKTKLLEIGHLNPELAEIKTGTTVGVIGWPQANQSILAKGVGIQSGAYKGTQPGKNPAKKQSEKQ